MTRLICHIIRSNMQYLNLFWNLCNVTLQFFREKALMKFKNLNESKLLYSSSVDSKTVNPLDRAALEKCIFIRKSLK